MSKTTDNDDDILTAPVPEPDDEPSASERARAKTFAELVDKTLSGRTPPAMSADDRALLEVATVIRAASGGMELAPSRQRNLIEDALRQAVGGNVAATSLSTTPISRARARRWVPWMIAGTTSLVAAAAMVMLWVRTPKQQQLPAASAVKEEWYSRPTDKLIGAIPAERAGDASARVDTIFADRLDGYRDRLLSGRRGGKR
jgi:hypothetical protein